MTRDEKIARLEEMKAQIEEQFETSKANIKKQLFDKTKKEVADVVADALSSTSTTRQSKSNATLACEMTATRFLNEATEHSMQEFKLEIDTINGEDFYNISVDGDRLLEGSVKGLNLIQVTAFALRNYVIRHTNQIPF